MSYLWIILALSYGLLLGFFAYVGALQAWPRLKVGIKVLVAPAFFLIYLLDILLNVTVGSLLFLELPSWRLKTFSERCESHMSGVGYRGSVGRAFCFLLNSIIEGHCKK